MQLNPLSPDKECAEGSRPVERPQTLWDWFARERMLPLLVVVVLADFTSVWLIDAGEALFSRLFQEVLLFGLQFGVLSCLGLWIALAAHSWLSRVPAAIAVISASMLVLASYRSIPGAEVATMFIGHVVILSLLAFLLRLAGVIRAPDSARGEEPLRRYSLRHIFVWMTVIAGLAFLTRYADFPRGVDVIFIVGSCPLLALSVAFLVTHVKSVLLHTTLALFVAVLLAMGLSGLTTGTRIEEFLAFHVCQAALLLLWGNMGLARRPFEEGKCPS